MIVSISGDRLHGKPRSTPRLQVLSAVGISQQLDYDGPTWLDRALFTPKHLEPSPIGFGRELKEALEGRGRWLIGQKLAERRVDGSVSPRAERLALLREREATYRAQMLSRRLHATHIPHEVGDRVIDVYDGSIPTPTGKLAVIRHQETFTLAPWRPALEPMRGRAVTGLVQQHR